MYRDQSTISCRSPFEMYRDLSVPAMLFDSVNDLFCWPKWRKKVPASNHLTSCLDVFFRHYFYRHGAFPEAPTARKTPKTRPSNGLTFCCTKIFLQNFYRQASHCIFVTGIACTLNCFFDNGSSDHGSKTSLQDTHTSPVAVLVAATVRIRLQPPGIKDWRQTIDHDDQRESQEAHVVSPRGRKMGGFIGQCGSDDLRKAAPIEARRAESVVRSAAEEGR